MQMLTSELAMFEITFSQYIRDTENQSLTQVNGNILSSIVNWFIF